jgi:hypothetical protein
MPGASRPGAHFRVDFDDATFAEDLEHTSSGTGRTLAQRERDKLTDEGLPPGQLKRCDTEARDGTSLPGCVKIYIPKPNDAAPCLPAASRVAHGGGPIGAPLHLNDVLVTDRHDHVGDPLVHRTVELRRLLGTERHDHAQRESGEFGHTNGLYSQTRPPPARLLAAPRSVRAG